MAATPVLSDLVKSHSFDPHAIVKSHGFSFCQNRTHCSSWRFSFSGISGHGYFWTWNILSSHLVLHWFKQFPIHSFPNQLCHNLWPFPILLCELENISSAVWCFRKIMDDNWLPNVILKSNRIFIWYLLHCLVWVNIHWLQHILSCLLNVIYSVLKQWCFGHPLGLIYFKINILIYWEFKLFLKLCMEHWVPSLWESQGIN